MKHLGRLFGIVIAVLAGVLIIYLIMLRGTEVAHITQTGVVNNCAFIGMQESEEAGPELVSSTGCGTIDEHGVLLVEKAILKRLYFKGAEPSCILLRDKAFYVDKLGRTKEAYLFDSGCDYFTEGLARAPSAQGIRFIDNNLNIVIATPYQFATPFQDGFAVVCNGLRLRRALYNEHEKFVGGQCGYIDKKGRVVVPLRYPIEEVYGHHPR